VHGTRSGVASFVHDDEELASPTSLSGFPAPVNNLDRPQRPPARRDTDDARLAGLVPAEPNQPYDMLSVITELVGDGDFIEVQALWARNIICASAASTAGW